MPVDRPYRRTCRQFVDGHYTEGGRWEYMIHPKFAQSPSHYVRAFLILLKDLQELFDYVEPADKNLSCYSYRIHALLLRACVEVEANCKAILKENAYNKTGDWNMGDYKKIEKTHLLSRYEVKVPNWNGIKSTRLPFSAWASGGALPWYQAYNTTKHDRHSQFEEATFEHLIDASCGLLALLSSQFETNDFSPGNTYLAIEGGGDGMESVVSEDTFAFGSLPIGQTIYAMTLTGKSSRAKPTRFGLSTIQRSPNEALLLTGPAGYVGKFCC